MALRSFKNAARVMVDPVAMPAEEFEAYLVRVVAGLDRRSNRLAAASWRNRRALHRVALLRRLQEAHRNYKPSEVVSPEGDVLPQPFHDPEPLLGADVGGPTAKREGERSEG